jgi:hypothetical protein
VSVHTQAEFAIHIIEKAKTFGASLAGLANIAGFTEMRDGLETANQCL